MKYASNNIRNILIAGHAGSGKTTLTEALVYFSGAAERMGRVEDGTTISDFDPEEAKRKASLSASVVPVEYEGIKYNLIDAPGLFDFEAGEYEGIRAAESVLVCVSGRSGVTVGAEKAFQLARKNGKATMVFISKCDLENANYFKILEEMKIKFGSTVCPCVVPAKLDDGTPVYINLFSQKAFKYESGKQIQVELPDIGHRFQGLIEAMSEAIAETDDELMEKFFGGEPFTTEEIVEGMRKGVKDGLITPVFCGSAVNQQALDMLLFNMHKLLPSPQHDAAILAENASGEPVELHCDENEPTAAYVFKTVADPFVGKLSYLRVISGKVTGGAALVNARTGETEKISKPLTVIGKKQTETDGIGAGDIGAVAKLVSAKTGDTLCDASRVVKLPAAAFPLPSLFMAVTVAKKGDEGKISSALARLMEEDPTLSYINNAETHQQIIGGLGEQHLDVVKAKLKNKFGVEIGLEAPRIAYRESIRTACRTAGVEYHRLLRAPSALPAGSMVFQSAAHVADLLAQTQGNVLLATGAKELPAFAQLAPERLYPRVLPTLDGIAACEAAHIPHKNILALQGPFSYALNRALLEQFSIRFLVTKDGGAAGGFAEKTQAAADTGVQLIVIRRPAETGETADQILTRCREVLKG